MWIQSHRCNTGTRLRFGCCNFFFKKTSTIVSAQSCFLSHIVPLILSHSINYIANSRENASSTYLLHVHMNTGYVYTQWTQHEEIPCIVIMIKMYTYAYEIKGPIMKYMRFRCYKESYSVLQKRSHIMFVPNLVLIQFDIMAWHF